MGGCFLLCADTRHTFWQEAGKGADFKVRNCASGPSPRSPGCARCGNAGDGVCMSTCAVRWRRLARAGGCVCVDSLQRAAWGSQRVGGFVSFGEKGGMWHN